MSRGHEVEDDRGPTQPPGEGLLSRALITSTALSARGSGFIAAVGLSFHPPAESRARSAVGASNKSAPPGTAEHAH
eukprot:scaffold90162_cov56-Phaeocystis_antarctica.AAC.8